MRAMFFLEELAFSAKLNTQRAKTVISDNSSAMIFFLLINSASSEILWFEETRFIRGSGVAPDETPQHKVSLSAYEFDRHEVSIAEFESFRKQGWGNEKYWHPEAHELAPAASRRCRSHQSTRRARGRSSGRRGNLVRSRCLLSV